MEKKKWHDPTWRKKETRCNKAADKVENSFRAISHMRRHGRKIDYTNITPKQQKPSHLQGKGGNHANLVFDFYFIFFQNLGAAI